MNIETKTYIMRTTLSLLIITLLFINLGVAQEHNADAENNHSAVESETVPQKIIESDSLSFPKESADVIHDSQEVPDTLLIRFGNKRMIIVEREGKTTIEFPEETSKGHTAKGPIKTTTIKRRARFRGHWAGFQWGFSGIVDSDYSLNLVEDNKFLELKQGRSWNFNLNPLQYSFGLGTNLVGIVTGLGLEFNNYNFRNPYTLKVENGITVPDDSYASDLDKNVKKSRLSTTHLTAPILLEFQIPTHSRHRIFFSAGVIGGVRIGSHTRVVYDGDGKGKDKTKDDFNLSTFRYGISAQVGYRAIKLFANYYPTSLFEKGKGPEVYPFTIGLTLISF